GVINHVGVWISACELITPRPDSVALQKTSQFRIVDPCSIIVEPPADPGIADDPPPGEPVGVARLRAADGGLSVGGVIGEGRPDRAAAVTHLEEGAQGILVGEAVVCETTA